ncbi:hypothetical protein BASA81_009781 [Batrachochytrium salamandrivorans]|nr:hypothetical protein BASA81_009781 [Batrachochytrium salamandrivorans]
MESEDEFGLYFELQQLPTDGGGGEDQDGEDKAKKRRLQIAAASRASRARRKRELDDLRDENQRLALERSQLLGKISQLQTKVEDMRKRSATDLRGENEQLRVQLSEHRRFVSSFKRLCDGAPLASMHNGKHQLLQQHSEQVYKRILELLVQSQTWQTCVALPNDLTSASFCELEQAVRLDMIMPHMEDKDEVAVSKALWDFLGNTDAYERLFNVKAVELSVLTESLMPNKDFKQVYYREYHHNHLMRDQDWVLTCSQMRRSIDAGILTKDQAEMKCTILTCATATATTTFTAPFAGVDRIIVPAMFGVVCWNTLQGVRVTTMHYVPSGLHTKVLDQGWQDVVQHGQVTPKFLDIISRLLS